jgi:putative DNA primase/helicase
MTVLARRPGDRIEPAYLADLKARVPLASLIGMSVNLVKLRGQKGLWSRCPFHQERTPSFSVWPDHYHCFGCNQHGDHIAWLEHYERLDFLAAVDRLCELAGEPRLQTETVTEHRPEDDAASRANNQRQALRLWDEAFDPTGTLVDVYLASRRLVLTDDVANRVVRFHPSCPFGQGRHPCMVTLFRDIRTDELRAIQRTALQPDGSKISRLTLGPCRGAAIKISPDDDVTMGLTIGEGFETCLAASQLGFRPVWALGSAGAIKEFPVLSGIEALSILAETGPASADATTECRIRWNEAGQEVWVVTPKIGDDLNTALMMAERVQ